jgi:hypothetical protein
MITDKEAALQCRRWKGIRESLFTTKEIET